MALEDRAQRRLHDIAVEPDGVEAADIVVLHRVVCCYPNYERLLGAAAQRARRLLVFTMHVRPSQSRLAGRWTAALAVAEGLPAHGLAVRRNTRNT